MWRAAAARVKIVTMQIISQSTVFTWHSASRPVRHLTTAAPHALPRATSGTSHATAARVQVQLLERLADLAFPPHSRTSSRPQIYQRCVHARRAVEGSPRSAARPMRAQTRAASPPCSVPPCSGTRVRRRPRWWASRASRASRASQMCMGTPGGGVAHRGRLLEGDADAAARGVFDGLFSLVIEVVVLQAATQGGEVGVREH